MEIQKTIIEKDKKEGKLSSLCRICRKRYRNLNALGIHIKRRHRISTKEYYDTFFKEEGEDICIICGKETRFRGLWYGYGKICSSFTCIGKYRLRICLEKHPNHQSESGKMLHIKYPNHRYRMGKLGGKAAQVVLKRENKGWYNSEEQKKLSIKRFEKMIRETPYVYEDKRFLSKDEIRCYKILREVFGKEDIAVNMFIGAKSIDFFIKSISFFIEFHPKTINSGWNIATETKEEYYLRRRKVLDESEFVHSKLLVFQNLKEAREWIESLKQ